MRSPSQRIDRQQAIVTTRTCHAISVPFFINRKRDLQHGYFTIRSSISLFITHTNKRSHCLLIALRVDRAASCVNWLRTRTGWCVMQASESLEDDGNLEQCVLCTLGGSLLCCDGCPAAYHLRCLGEGPRSIPDGEWLCPECILGGRGVPPPVSYTCGREPQCLPCVQPTCSTSSMALRHTGSCD